MIIGYKNGLFSSLWDWVQRAVQYMNGNLLADGSGTSRGLQNLGNTCFINCVSVESFEDSFSSLVHNKCLGEYEVVLKLLHIPVAVFRRERHALYLLIRVISMDI